MSVRLNHSAVLVSTLALCSGHAAHAAITGVGGQTVWLGTPPTSCVSGALTGQVAYAWDEQQGILASSVLADEIMNPGGSASPVAGLVSGLVDSHFVHHQGVPGIIGVQGSVTFATPIVGVIYRALNLDATDAGFGATGTVYPTSFPLRGMSTGPSNFFTVSGNTFTFHAFSNLSVGEVVQFRIFTSAVPAPGAAALMGLAGLAAARRRRGN